MSVDVGRRGGPLSPPAVVACWKEVQCSAVQCSACWKTLIRSGNWWSAAQERCGARLNRPGSIGPPLAPGSCCSHLQHPAWAPHQRQEFKPKLPPSRIWANYDGPLSAGIRPSVGARPAGGPWHLFPPLALPTLGRALPTSARALTTPGRTAPYSMLVCAKLSRNIPPWGLRPQGHTHHPPASAARPSRPSRPHVPGRRLLRTHTRTDAHTDPCIIG
jgi:hypothetical protein